MRIGIDCRRGIGSGVGRLTQNIIGWMGASSGSCDVVLFVNENSVWQPPEGVKTVETGISYHSAGDFNQFPQLVSDHGIDVFVATQYYISPYIDCATIRFIHDLWPLYHPEWIPSTAEFAARYGEQCLRDSAEFGRRFISSSEGRMLIGEHEHVSRFLEENGSQDIARHYAIMFLLSVTRADIVASPSRHSMKEIAAVFPRQADKVRLVPNSVNPLFRPSNAQRDDSILHVGNWECRKNIEVLLEAFGRLRDGGRTTELVLAGNGGNSDYTRRIERLIREHPHREAIRQLGLIEDRELVLHYQRSRVFVCPSLHEGFGIPSIEAMACGTPVIGAHTSAVPEVCGDAALYFDPANPASLLETLEGFFDDQSLSETLRARALSRAAHFSDRNAAENFAALVEEPALRQTPVPVA